jgi:low temperature requirement protein LtrA
MDDAMTTSGGARLLRKPGQGERATFLELFFDLVFIFALTRISDRLVTDITTERRVVLTEAGKTLLILLAFWLVWFVTALITDLYDPEQTRIQLLIVATMLASLAMAVAVPGAFAARGLLFAGAYVAIHIGRGLFLVPALRGHPAQRRAAWVLFWFAVSAVPWIGGALFPAGVARGVLWTLAIMLDYAAQVFRLPAPRLGRPSLEQFPIVAEHLSERYRQFFIIALGELILVIGITFSSNELSASRAAAFVTAFATTGLLWRIYLYRAGELLPAVIAGARQPSRLAQWVSMAHLLMVIGIVAISAGFELVIRHPLGHTDAAWAAVILGGPALYLVGRGLFEYGLFGRVSRSRLIGAVALVAWAVVAVHTPPLTVAVAAVVVLLGVSIADAVRTRARPPEMPAR